MGAMGAYRFLQSGDVGIGAVMGLMPGVPTPMWSYYIGVDDIDRAAAAVTANGGTITNEPMEIPGGEYAMNGIDPQGAARSEEHTSELPSLMRISYAVFC